MHDVASTTQATDLFLASRSTHINIYQHHINSPLLPSYSHKSQTNFLPLSHFLYTHYALSPLLVFRGPPAPPLPSPDDQSLTSILETPRQRSDFTLLIASATASMHKPSCNLHPRPRRRQRAPPNRRCRPPRAQNLSAIDIPAADKARRARAARRKATEAELAHPETQALQPAALAYFDAWRDTVLQRVDEVLNSSAASPQPPHRSRPARAPHPWSWPRPRGARVLPPRARDQSVGAALQTLYPPLRTPLTHLADLKRALLLLLLASSRTARTRGSCSST